MALKCAWCPPGTAANMVTLADRDHCLNCGNYTAADGTKLEATAEHTPVVESKGKK